MLYDLAVCGVIAAIAKGSARLHGDKVFKEAVEHASEEIKGIAGTLDIVSLINNSETLIPKWAFINFITIFETWLSDVLREILRAYPQKIRRDKVDSAIIIDSSSHEECLEKLIDEELIRLSYASTKEFTKRLQEITSTDIESVSELLDVYELKAARNIILHNRGIVNEKYLKQAGEKARAQIGEEIKLDSESLINSFNILESFVTEVSDKLVKKYKEAEKK